MAHYRHLPVWKAALDLAVHLDTPCGALAKPQCPFLFHFWEPEP